MIPYYDEPSPLEAPYIYTSQAKNGTCSFYAYATFYVIKKHKRVTLAIKAVQQQNTKQSAFYIPPINCIIHYYFLAFVEVFGLLKIIKAESEQTHGISETLTA
ncbi:MAG: hypothetical protein V7K41_14625 [Nostoc sp.]